MEPQSSDAPNLEQNLDSVLALALDRAIEAHLAGRLEERDQLLARHPELTAALQALAPANKSSEANTHPSHGVRPEGPPTQIGPYRIERELGSGSFGAVYLAFDSDLRRQVALKVIHAGRLGQAGILERFQREACATARLRHARIIQLYDYSREGPPYYLVTEYVEGTDLRQWRQCKHLLPNEVAELVARIAEAIDHAHSQGVYHRDLKPGNILMDSSDEPHILDFGLARLYAEFDEAGQTSEGRILGTLAYMAPEQAAGRSHEADARSDVYSLGVILYELLTGRLPFEGPAHSLPSQIVEETPPSPKKLNFRVPADLEAICLKAMAKQPSDRYMSAAALASDIRSFLRGEPTEARALNKLFRMIISAQNTLRRRNKVIIQYDWSTFLILQAATILAGSALANWWLVAAPSAVLAWPVLLIKITQVLIMLLLLWRMRPTGTATLEAGERQIMALVPGYYGGFFTVWFIFWFWDEQRLLAPMLAVMSGFAFMTLGASIWGILYIWGAGFFALAIALAFTNSQWGLFWVGLGWFLCLVHSSRQLGKKK